MNGQSTRRYRRSREPRVARFPPQLLSHFCSRFAPAAFGETRRSRPMIADFKKQTEIKISPIQATTAMTRIAGKPALEITTEAAASWPGALIEPREGQWDLSGSTGSRWTSTIPRTCPSACC